MFHKNCGHVCDQVEDKISYTKLMWFTDAYGTPEIQLNSIRQQNPLPHCLAICFTDIFVLIHKKSKVKVVRVQAMKVYGRFELWLHSLLTLASDGDERSADALSTLPLVSTK
jgi:hypothetical protein